MFDTDQCSYHPTDEAKRVCECPLAHPRLVALLKPIWWALPGRAQAGLAGEPCWIEQDEQQGDPADMFVGGRAGRLIARIRAGMANWGDRADARDQYFAGGKAMRGIWKRLEREADPTKRAAVFHEGADILHGMAAVYPTAFGPHPIPWENGRDLAESTALSATLMFVLGEVEDAVADPDAMAANLPPAACALTWGADSRVDTPEVRAVLERMAGTPDVRNRAVIAENELYDAVVPLVGGQAAETISSIPVPKRA